MRNHVLCLLCLRSTDDPITQDATSNTADASQAVLLAITAALDKVGTCWALLG